MEPTLFRDSKEAARSLPHKEFDRAQLLLFAGKREQGKTTTLRAYLEDREPRVLAFDPFEDFSSIRRRLSWNDALDDLEPGTACRRRIVPPIDAGSREYAERVFAGCVDRLRNCLLVLDEITLWSDAREGTTLRTLVLQGRRLGIRLAVACQRIALVPDVFKSEATQMILFRMNRPRDLKTVEEWTDKATAERCAQLGQGQCLVVDL